MNSALRIPHSAFRISHSALRIPHSAFPALPAPASAPAHPSARQPRGFVLSRGVASAFPAVILAAVLLATPFFLTSCATQNVPGRLLASTVQTVDSAMQGWATYVALGNASVDQENAVRAAYAKYQAAENAAEVAYVVAAKTGDTSGWQRAADALRASQRALLALVNQFTPPKP